MSFAKAFSRSKQLVGPPAARVARAAGSPAPDQESLDHHLEPAADARGRIVSGVAGARGAGEWPRLRGSIHLQEIYGYLLPGG